jgi:hypothetical protein
VPSGYYVYRSGTNNVFVFLRGLLQRPKDLDPPQVMAYPLNQFDRTMKTKDWKKVPNFPAPATQGAGEIVWVNPGTFFDQLPGVLDKVPPLPGEETTYTLIRSVLDAAAKDPQVKQILKETAIAADKDLIAPLFH